MTTTPEFIAWAIEKPCALRDHDRWREPEFAERQLRGVRAFGQACVDQRVFEKVCVDPSGSSGFLTDEVLAYFGGESPVREQCESCAANLLARQDARLLAGCFGMFVWQDLQPSLFELVDQAVVALCIEDEFPRTTPRWHGLWMETPLQGPKIASILQVLEHVVAHVQIRSEELNDFTAALRTSHENNLPLHFTYSAAGETRGRTWTINPHCSQCKTTMSEQAKHCSVCGRTGGPTPVHKRNARGKRPFQPFDQILGEENVEEFLTRYQNRPLQARSD